jgi:acetyl-CoA synthetase
MAEVFGADVVDTTTESFVFSMTGSPEKVKAFVALRPGYEPGEELQLELVGFARKRLGAAVAPRQIDFRDDLPKTRSGKIMRRLLRARELGLPEGDISTLESDER